MIGIDSVTNAGGASAVVGLIGTPGSAPATSVGGTGFGPDYLLGGGSALQTAQGLYNQLGQMMSAANPHAAALQQAASARDEKRVAELEYVAAMINAGDAVGGRAAAERIIKKNGQDASALALVGRSYMVEKNYSQAEKYYGQAAALAPDQARIQSDLENAKVLQNSDEEVLRIARQKMKNPSNTENGLRLLSELISRDPFNVDAHLAMSDGFKAQGQELDALFALQKAQAFATSSNSTGVIERAERFAEEHHDVGLTHHVLGLALNKVGRSREGIRELETARRLAPDNVTYGYSLAEAYVNRAEEHLDTGNLQSAKGDLARALAITPSADGYRDATAKLELTMGERDLSAGRYTMAMKHLNLAKGRAPDDEAFKQRLSKQFIRAARHYEDGGNTDSALSAYRSANELDPDSIFARHGAATLSYAKGMELRAQGLHEDAIRHLDRAYQLNPRNDTYRTDLAIAYDRYGVALQALGELDDAVKNFTLGYRLDHDNAELSAHYFAALAEQNS